MRRWGETRRQFGEPGLKMDSKAVRLKLSKRERDLNISLLPGFIVCCSTRERWLNKAVAGKQRPGGHIDERAATVSRSHLGSVSFHSWLLRGLCSSPEIHNSDLPAASVEVDEEDGSSWGVRAPGALQQQAVCRWAQRPSPPLTGVDSVQLSSLLRLSKLHPS